MPSVTLVKDINTGKLAGMTDKDKRAFDRFVERTRTLDRSCITFDWKEPRSGPFHRFFFAALNSVFEAQERFDDLEQLLCWAKVGAGFCEFIPNPKQGMVAIPKSIAFSKLDQAEFKPVADAIFGFLRSEHARSVLWPHLYESASFEMIERALESFA